jgi:DNA-binding transcriptional MocR family regulator
LPDLDTGQLREKARAFNVGLRQGVLFSSQDGLRDHMRLCFAFYGEENIEEGVLRLKQCLDAVQMHPKQGTDL